MSAPRWGVDAVYDIECADWDQFLCGSVWTARGGVEVYEDPREMARAITSLPRGTQLWGHAGGKYDALWYLDVITHEDGKPPKARINLSGGSATSIQMEGGPHLRDSNRLLPMSLAKAARIAGPGRKKGDPGLPCKCGEDCGGYCSLSRSMSRKHWRSTKEYLVDDVELLRDVLIGVQEYSEAHGLELRGTVGGSAWATAKEWCDLPDAEWDRDTYYMTRAGYMGGRCEVGITQAPGVWRYDRKSAYPAALMEPIPVGERSIVTGAAASRAWSKGKPGIYQMIVDVPEMAIPPLPHRYKGRLTYPWGVFTGSWSHVELQHAESVGVKIRQVISGVIWSREEAVLRPFAKKCFDLRDEITEPDLKASLGTWLKFVANSATGKLGQSPESEQVVLGDFADDARYSIVGQSPWIWSREAWRIPNCGHVQWSATLTARARVELHKQQLHAGSAWAYSDTDSCFATRKLTRRIGEDLGEWAFEGHAECPPKEEMITGYPGMGWVGLAPKVYAYWDRDKRRWIAHAKGVPDGDTIDKWRRYANGYTVSADRGVYGLKTAVSKSDRLFQRKHVERTLHKHVEWCGARKRDGNVTLAPHVSDLATLP